MRPTVVVHRNEPHDVYVGRPSKWGNPFFVGPRSETSASFYRCDSRHEAIERHATWILTQRSLMADLHELKGKRIACWCRSAARRRPCHAQTLARLADLTAR